MNRFVVLFRGRGLFVLAGLLAVVFTLLTALVLRADLQPTSWDIGITHEIQEFPDVPVGTVLVAVSLVGFAPWNFVLPIVVLAFMLAMRWRVEAGFVALAASGGLLAEVIKNVVDRPRPTPDFARIYQTLTTYSFPSGHVTGYVVLFGFIFYLAFVSLPKGNTWRRVLMVICGTLIVLVGPSRVYMGQHWASDALAGYALGFCYLVLVISLHRWYLEKKKGATPAAVVSE